MMEEAVKEQEGAENDRSDGGKLPHQVIAAGVLKGLDAAHALPPDHVVAAMQTDFGVGRVEFISAMWAARSETGLSDDKWIAILVIIKRFCLLSFGSRNPLI